MCSPISHLHSPAVGIRISWWKGGGGLLVITPKNLKKQSFIGISRTGRGLKKKNPSVEGV